MKRFDIPAQLRSLYIAGLVIGIVCLIAAFAISPARAWHGYVLNYYFFMTLGLGGVFFVGTQHLTNAGWSATVRRIPESFNAWFPLAVVLFIPIFFGGHSIYAWMKPEVVAADANMRLKLGYLNMPFFVIRTIAFFALWYLIGGQMVRNSLKQDSVGGLELTKKNVKLSAIFMPLFAILFSLTSFDLLMTFDPHWFSTMFGVNCFANLFLSTLAALVITVVTLKKKGYLGHSVNENHIQMLGLLMFAFVVFYAYITFCQFMLIWYANLPEETSYYLRRWEHGWSLYAMGIVFVKFVIPFIVLLPREAKRNPDRVRFMAVWILLACWVDQFWMVMPNYSQTPVLPFLEFGIGIGFAAAFGWTVTSFLSKVPIEPMKDPRLHEAVHLHQ